MDFPRRFETKRDRVRHVRTVAGAEHFGLPIGAPIVAGAPQMLPGMPVLDPSMTPEQASLNRDADYVRSAPIRRFSEHTALLRDSGRDKMRKLEEMTADYLDTYDYELSGTMYQTFGVGPDDVDGDSADDGLTIAMATQGPWIKFGPCRQIREAAFEMLGFDTDEEDQVAADKDLYGYKPSWGGAEEATQHPDMFAYALLSGIKNADRRQHMYRGVTFSHPMERDAYIETLREGATFDLPLASFTEDREAANRFGMDVTFVLMGGARAVLGGKIALHSQRADPEDEYPDDDDFDSWAHEWVSGGRFKVQSVHYSRTTNEYGEDVDGPTLVYIRQQSVFDPDTGLLVKEDGTLVRLHPAIEAAFDLPIVDPATRPKPRPKQQSKAAKPLTERESVIIALLPAIDDPIHTVSSEKHAHVTVVFLGSLDPSMDDAIHEAVRHAATSIKPVTLPIISREPLGDQDADVLMLDVTEFQSVYDMLTNDPAVSAAMRYAEQYPKWTPHLTLGYPKDPAKADLDQTTIRFDRLSLWIGDSVGQTFTLGERVKPNRLQTKVRYVRTPEGREKYGLPIGSPIYAQPDVPLEAYSPEWDAVVTEHLDAHDAADARITDDSTVADEGFDRTVWRGLRMDLPPDLAARLRASYDSPTGPENTLLIHEVGAELLHLLRTHRGGYSARGPEGRSGIGIHWTTSRRFAAIAEQQGGDGQYGFCIQAQIRDEDVASEKMIERTVGTWGDGKGGGDEDEWTMDPFATVRITALTLWGDEKRNLLGEPVDVSLTDGPNVMQDATDYRIAHQPADIDDGNTLDDMTMMMPDYIERPDLYGFDDMSLETAKLAHGNPDQLVRVYRAVPRSVDTINPGDWVTTSRDYALQHSLYEEDTTHIIFATVRAGDITTDGNSPMEYGYMGEKPMQHASMAPIPLKVTASTKDYQPGDTLQGNRVVDPEELPDTMYHVTTAMRAVMDSDGVLRAANGNEQAGMGGGHQGTVSLTTDRQTAEQILADMNLYRDIVNMDSVEDVMRSFLDLPDVDVASKEQMAQMRAYVDGGFDGEPPILFREAKYGVPSLAHYLLGSYFVHRRSQLGIQNPLIIVVGKTNPFVGMNPDDIGILEVEKSSLNSRAALTDYDLREPMPYTLHEVRVHGDVQTRRI